MNVSKILIVPILTLLAAGIFWGCTGQTLPFSEKNSDNPTPQPATGVSKATVAVVNTPAVSSTVAPAQKEENTGPILIVTGGEVISLDPYLMVGVNPDGSVASHLWDTLTWLNNDLQIEPGVAESWRLINNFTWEFKLRQGISFHNGELLDAETVRFSVERAQTMPGSLETFAKDVDLDKVEIIDDYTLRFVTRKVVSNLPYYLAFLEILPPTYYSTTSPDQLALAPIGSGPYQLDNWTPGERLVLEAVPTYWRGAPALPQLIFEAAPFAPERLAALRAGNASLVTDLAPTNADQWNLPDSRIEAIESTQRVFIGLLVEAGSPLADKGVRQALNYGVNVKQIVNNLLEGYGNRYGSWVNPPANNQDLTPWPYDPDQARDLLIQAGYEEGFTTTLRSPSDVHDQDSSIAEAIAQQLAEIGVIVNVEPVTWSTYTSQLLSGDVPPLFLLRLNSRGDGLEDVTNLSRTFAFNVTGWQSVPFEDTLEQAADTFNENSKSRLLNEAQAIAYDEAPWIWLWRSYDFYGVSQTLEWSPRRDGLVNLYKPVSSPSTTK
jgi:peptide/nickel transport system substrate-binding protein